MSTAARIDELRKKFEEHPRRYFAPLANEYRKAGELAQAIALCREHLPQQPGHMSGYIVFGQALYESGALSEARTVFEQALALDPENFIALRHLGDIAKMNGDTSGARRWYERVLDADPRNDDIAAQLASLAAMPTPPMASPPIPVFMGHQQDRAIEAASTPLRVSGPASGTAVSVPTPNQSMRVVDFDQVNALLTHQAPLDLDAIEQLVEAAEERESPQVTTSETTPSAASEMDDAFGFPPMELSSAGSPIDTEPDPAFEAGIEAPVWPDTSDLVSRVVSPRSSTPIDVPVTADAVAAFGREPTDPVLKRRGDLLTGHLADVVGPDVLTPPGDMLGDDIVRGDDAWLRTDDQARARDDATNAEADVEDDSVRRSVELTWLVTPASNDALQWISANDRTADNDDAPPVAREIASVFADDALTVLPSDPDLPPVNVWAGPDDTRQPTADAHVSEDAPDASGGPAFVTATMAELLVAQGYLTRAAEVYDELYRRQPNNLALAERLSQLRLRIAHSTDSATPRSMTPPAGVEYAALAGTPPPTYGTPVWVNSMIPSAEGGEAEAMVFLAAAGDGTARIRTAREQFARLAARRAVRDAIAAATPAAQGDGLASLFGVHSDPSDDHAARELADAFAPISAAHMSDGTTLDLTAGAPPVIAARSNGSPSAWPSGSPSDVSDAFAFDRFFPDPATTSGAGVPQSPAAPPTAGDDLAEFAAWLKGLGSQ